MSLSKLTTNKSFKELSEQSQKNALALIQSTNQQVSNIITGYSDTIKELIEIEKNKSGWETALNLAYSTVRGFLKNSSNALFGLAEMGTKLVADLGEVFKHEGRFGDGINGFLLEVSSDILFAASNQMVDAISGTISGGVGVIGSITGKNMDPLLNAIKNAGTEVKYATLYGGYGENKQQGDVSFEMPGVQYIGGGKANKTIEQKEAAIEAHQDNWQKDALTWLNNANISTQKFILDDVLSMIGYETPPSAGTEAFLSGVAESIGGMLPSMLLAAASGSPDKALATASTYFYAMGFGGALSEALEKGANMDDAIRYAHGVASIEALSEQLPLGFIPGKRLPTKIIGAAFSEGLEEVFSELASVGLEHATEGTMGDTSDIWSRALYAGLAGMVSGGFFAMTGKLASAGNTMEQLVNIHDEIKSLYELEGKDYNKTQENINKHLKRTVDNLNKKRRTDKYFVEEGKYTEENILEGKKRTLNDLKFAREFIEYNEETGQFELNKKGVQASTNLELFLSTQHRGVALNSQTHAISENMDSGIELDPEANPVSKEALENLKDEKKKAVIKDILKNNRNVVIVDGSKTDGNFTIVGGINSANKVIYLDINQSSAEMVASTQAHEAVHKLAQTNPKAYNKIHKLMSDKKVKEALKQAGVTIMSDEQIENYIKLYTEQGMNEKQVRQSVQEENVAAFIEKVIVNPKLLEDVFNISPENIGDMGNAFGKIFGVDDKLKKIEKLFTKYGKRAMEYKRGSLDAAILKHSMQTTYVKIGNRTFKVPAQIAGFFNPSKSSQFLPANLEEVHKAPVDATGKMGDRGYSDFSKKELIKFFSLFNALSEGGNNIDAIIDNILLEYDNMVEYKEIIGTKFAYIWALAQVEPRIREILKSVVEPKITQFYNEAKANGKITSVGVKGMVQVKDAATFRKIFALNYLIGDPKYVSSVSLLDTRTYENEVDGMYLFNNGLGGYIIAKEEADIDVSYEKENVKQNYRKVFNSKEWASVFNNGEQKISGSIVNFAKKHAKQVIATNQKLVDIYEAWGFKTRDMYDFDIEYMSEWSNSYANFVLWQSKMNNASALYGTMLRKIIKGMPIDKFMEDFNPITPSETEKAAKELHEIFAKHKEYIVDGEVDKTYQKNFEELEDREKAYVNRNYISYFTLLEYLGYDPDGQRREAKYLPIYDDYNVVENGEVVRSNIKVEKINKLAEEIGYSERIENTAWNVDLIAQEMANQGRVLTQSEILKLKNFVGNDFRQLGKILETGYSHHVGIDYKLIPFYKVNVGIIEAFLKDGTVKDNYFEENDTKLGVVNFVAREYGKIKKVTTPALFIVPKSESMVLNREDGTNTIDNSVVYNEKGELEKNGEKLSYKDGKYTLYTTHVFGKNSKLEKYSNNGPIIIDVKDGEIKDVYLSHADGYKNPNVEITFIAVTTPSVYEGYLDYDTKIASYVVKSMNKNLRTMFKVSGTTRVDSSKVDVNIETTILANNLENSYATFDKPTFERKLKDLLLRYNQIDLKALKKTKGGKKIAAIIEKLTKDYEMIIKKNVSKSELYNHLMNNVTQLLMVELATNFNETSMIDKSKFIDNVLEMVSDTIAYLDNVFRDNATNKTSANNPEGLQYTRLFTWGLRDLLPASGKTIQEVVKNGKLNPLWDLIESALKLNLEDNNSVLEFDAALKAFKNATHVEQVNSASRDGVARTIDEVIEDVSWSIDDNVALVGQVEVTKKGKKSVYKRAKGLLGIGKTFRKLSSSLRDMFAMGNIFGLFMKKSMGNAMVNLLVEGTRRQLEVNNAFNDYFEKDGFTNKHRKEINNLEKDFIEIQNVVDDNGKPILIPKSQIIYLKQLLLRELVRNQLIDKGYRGGEKSKLFIDGGTLIIYGNTNNRKTNQNNKRTVNIKNVMDLFNELNGIVTNDAFMKAYDTKVLGFFQLMYKYENMANKDIKGLELTNDSETIANLTEDERQAIRDEIGQNIDLTNIYVPIRSEEGKSSAGGGAFNIESVIDLGVSDGMVMGVQEHNRPPVIDSINNVVPQYSRGVMNFYGLYRVINDLNILFNKDIDTETGQVTTIASKVNSIDVQIIKYFESLLRDMAGYGVEGDTTSEGANRALGWVRRNFFKATLGLNVKVIFTQFASLYTVSTIYGDFKGTKKSLMISMFKNLFSRKTKAKAKYFMENSQFYKDRARNSNYEVSEATSSKFKQSRLNRLTEASMAGINRTDARINRALFVSLVEMGYSQEEALKMTEEAILRYQSGGLAINKPELLRTQHEFLKIFTKFLGEPMKVISNLQESAIEGKVIAGFEDNQDKINQYADEKVANEAGKLAEIEDQQKRLQEEADRLKDEQRAATNAKQRAQVKEKIKLNEAQQQEANDKKAKQEDKYEKTKKHTEEFKQQVQEVINSKGEHRRKFAKRGTALIMSLSWQAMLAVIFSMIRTGAGDKDEDEEVYKYLLSKFSLELMNEAVGMLPFARDVYNVIMNNFDANKVNDLDALNGTLKGVNALFKDMVNGGDFDYGKHTRTLSMTVGQFFGIPTRQIERFFTTPSRYLMKSANYSYRDLTGQQTTNKELNDAIARNDNKLIETIISRKLDDRKVLLSNSTNSEINRLAKNGVIILPTTVPDKFSIEGIEYKNDKDKFNQVYSNASHVIDKILLTPGYNGLSDEYKGKLIKAIFTYYYTLAKQEVSGVKLFTKERTYNLNQAFSYFRGRIPYYKGLQKKAEQEAKKQKK